MCIDMTSSLNDIHDCRKLIIFKHHHDHKTKRCFRTQTTIIIYKMVYKFENQILCFSLIVHSDLAKGEELRIYVWLI